MSVFIDIIEFYYYSTFVTEVNTMAHTSEILAHVKFTKYSVSYFFWWNLIFHLYMFGHMFVLAHLASHLPINACQNKCMIFQLVITKMPSYSENKVDSAT